MVVDIAVIVGMVCGVLLGRSEGLARGLWGFTGMLAGTAVGLAVVPRALGGLELSIWVSLGALAVVAVAAVVVRTLFLLAERWVHERYGYGIRQPYDRVLGAVFGGAVAVGVIWMVGLALAGSALPRVAPAVNSSRAISLLNEARLPISHLLRKSFSHIGHRHDFPRYVDVFTAETITPVAAPPEDVVDEPAIVKASHSVWKIISRGSALTGDEGTGFLVAPERLMTAAHVVDDTRGITVDVRDAELPATVVYCDPEHDVAVLAVPGLKGKLLTFAQAEAGQAAASVGYPNDQALTLRPARVRDHQTWQSSDIWDEGRYEHDALLIRGIVRGGNSGGPLVDEDGRVLGVIVASSRADSDTGYALTADQVAAAYDAARSGTTTPATTCQQ
nr:MarP family serine protease [uncultured Nocardioides sp.]